MAICAFASEPIKGMKIEDYPMCEGSRSTESIQRLLACKILGVPYCWHINNIGNMGIQTIVPYSPNGEYTSEQITEIVRRTQSWGLGHPPYKLLNKEVDLIFLTNETKERFDFLTVIYGIEVHEKEIGMDGLAILVNDDNPVKSLSIDQLQGIFSGGEVVSVRVYSLDGRLARTAQASESGISISGVPAGAYIVAAAFANGESCAQKICCF